MTELQLLAKRQKYKTSHILHLLLSLISFGWWVPVWVLVALSNANERMKIDKRLRIISNPKPMKPVRPVKNNRPIGFHW